MCEIAALVFVISAASHWVNIGGWGGIDCGDSSEHIRGWSTHDMKHITSRRIAAALLLLSTAASAMAQTTDTTTTSNSGLLAGPGLVVGLIVFFLFIFKWGGLKVLFHGF